MTTARDYLNSVLATAREAEWQLTRISTPSERFAAVGIIRKQLSDITTEVKSALESIGKAAAEL